MDRPNWDGYFLGIAEAVSRRASCPRATVGAVIVRGNRVLSTGYNGSSAGRPHCYEEGCDIVDNHCQRALHAEVNAVGYAARDGISIAGSILYLYRLNIGSDTGESVCRECIKVLRASGVNKVIRSGYISIL